MKTLYMETTKKTPAETSAEIEVLLSGYGLTGFNKVYDLGDVVGCHFTIAMDDKDVPIKLPVRWEPLLRMAENGETRYIRDKDQAQKVAWRQVLRWVEAQLALVDLEMVDIAEVFLPYMLIKDGVTLYAHMVNTKMRLLE